MKVALIILNYNDFETTKKLLDNIKLYGSIDKIIVVDNKSTNNSYESLIKYRNYKIDVIQTTTNKGYSSGNNFGVSYSLDKYNPEIIVIANPDVYFEEDIIKNLYDILNQNKAYGIASVQVNQGKNYYSLPGFIGGIKSMFLLSDKLSKERRKPYFKRINNNIAEVEVISGSFFAIRSKVFQEIEGFDEKTFLYCEENILSKKISRKGYINVLLSNVYYDHFHSVSIKKVYKSKVTPFLIYLESLQVYYYDYLNINNVQKKVFKILSKVALIERYIYDFFYRLYMKIFY